MNVHVPRVQTTRLLVVAGCTPECIVQEHRGTKKPWIMETALPVSNANSLQPWQAYTNTGKQPI